MSLGRLRRNTRKGVGGNKYYQSNCKQFKDLGG